MNNDNKIVIDLFGSPGTGKSTISSYFKEKYNLLDIKDWYINKFFGKIYLRLFLKLYKCNKILRKKEEEIVKILGSYNDYQNIISPETNISLFIKYMLFDYYLELKNKKNAIIDEGIIHNCLILMVEYNVSLEKIEKIYKTLKIDNIEYLGIYLDKESCYKNIKKRNRKRCYLDFLDDDGLKEILNKWDIAVKEICKLFKVYTYEELIEYIEKKVK